MKDLDLHKKNIYIFALHISFSKHLRMEIRDPNYTAYEPIGPIYKSESRDTLFQNAQAKHRF